jgi:hypothetical protein
VAEVPKRGGPTLVGTTALTIYTAPTDVSKWSIMRTVLLVNETSGPIIVSAGIFTSASDAIGRRIASQVTIQSDENWEWTGFLPLNPHATTPDIVYAISSVASGLTATVGVVEGP